MSTIEFQLKALNSALIKYSILFVFLFLSSMTQALNTHVTLQTDSHVTPTSDELVTFGLPIAEGEINKLADIKVSIGNKEISVFVEKGLSYHWSDNSLRSVTIQLQNVDMTAGDIKVDISGDGARLPRLDKVQPSKGWTKAGPNKNNLPYPRIFSLHDPLYLAKTGLIPPYLPAPEGGDPFETFQVGQFNSNFGGLDYSKSGASDWLFDRSSAMFKVYMTTGRLEFLKEAFLAKQFYFQYVKNEGRSPRQAGGDGCWAYKGVACADGKYIAPQQAKLAWALVGDDSQWDNELIVNMAAQSDLGWNQYASSDPYDKENEGFTERGAGLTGLAEVIAYEMTADKGTLVRLTQRISSLKDMQQTEKPWDKANGWIPKSGGFTHNIDVHEGNHNEKSAPLGDSNARGFSAWMIENIIDFLWQAYWITGNKDVPEMLKRAANAVEVYGFTSSYVETTGEYIRKPGYTSYNRTKSCNKRGAETDLLYMASAFADQETRISGDWWPYYSDTHNIETVLTLGLGFYFETDDAKRTRLASRINKILEGWINEKCSRVFSNVYRLFNWQHRSNSIRTWAWVAQQQGAKFSLPDEDFSVAPRDDSATSSLASADSLPVVSVPTRPLSDVVKEGGADVLVFVATAKCEDGFDPHWQCSARWLEYGELKITDYIAVCPEKEGGNYSDCLKYDKFIALSRLQSEDGLFICEDLSVVGKGRTACQFAKYVKTENLDD